ncbi:MAG: hypothetical protein WA771_14505, partial [Chthoniobacterales bacterium]
KRQIGISKGSESILEDGSLAVNRQETLHRSVRPTRSGWFDKPAHFRTSDRGFQPASEDFRIAPAYGAAFFCT